MYRTLIKTSLIVILVVAASVNTATALDKEGCKLQAQACLDVCTRGCKEGDDQCFNGCIATCVDLYKVCRVTTPCVGCTSDSGALQPPSTPPPVAQPPTSGLQPPPVAPTQPSSGNPPTKVGGPPISGVGVNQPPSSGSGTTPTPPKGPVHPIFPVNPNPVKVNEPGTGTSSGTTPIYDKSGGGTTIGSNLPGAGSGVSKMQTQDLIKSWQQKVNDKNSELYAGQRAADSTNQKVKSQIFNQSNQTSAHRGSGTQKFHNEMLHVEKEKSNVQNFSPPAASHARGGHR